MFGINGSEAVIIVLLGLILIGPERLPKYLQQFKSFMEDLRDFIKKFRQRATEDLGRDLDFEEIKKYDLRQYDPRRIVGEAFLDDAEPQSSVKTPQLFNPNLGPAPFDDEAT